MGIWGSVPSGTLMASAIAGLRPLTGGWGLGDLYSSFNQVGSSTAGGQGLLPRTCGLPLKAAETAWGKERQMLTAETRKGNGED